MAHADYYEVLGVQRNAEQQQIKDAYRELAFRYHPDRNKDDDGAAEKMKLVNEAYAVLSNPRKRSEYDGMRSRFGSASARDEFRRAYTEQDIFNGSDILRIFEEMARMHGMRGFEDIFRESYGSRYQTFQFQRPGFFFKGVVFGGGRAGRRGRTGRTIDRDRPSNRGVGRISRILLEKMAGRQMPRDGAHMVDTIHLSPQKAVEGGPYAYYHRKQAKKLVVKVPTGIRDGQKIRLAGLGEPGRGGGRPGDLYLRVTIRSSPIVKLKSWFRRLLGRGG
ncbi:MAG: DnaJ domain-containing protein [Desulfobacterales bacterium]